LNAEEKRGKKRRIFGEGGDVSKLPPKKPPVPILSKRIGTRRCRLKPDERKEKKGSRCGKEKKRPAYSHSSIKMGEDRKGKRNFSLLFNYFRKTLTTYALC